jgi:hypothetical protein
LVRREDRRTEAREGYRATLAAVRATLVLASLALGSRAVADPVEALAVVSPDPTFARAIDESFAAAGIHGVRVAGAPAAAIGDLTNAARRLADEVSASATIVLVTGDSGATLIVYDRGVDRVLLRELPHPPPLTVMQATEAARMARTMLRALRVTPELDLPPPRAVEAAAVRERAADAVVVPASPADAAVIAVDIGGGLRLGAPGATASESGSLALIWRPDTLAIAVAASFVPATRIEGDAFMGTVSDVTIAVTGRLPHRLGPRLSIGAEAGLAVHRLRLAGDLDGGAVDTSRLDPAVRAAATASFEVRAGVAAGVSVSVDGLLRRQDYSVGSAEILAVPAAQLTFGVNLIARIL